MGAIDEKVSGVVAKNPPPAFSDIAKAANDVRSRSVWLCLADRLPSSSTKTSTTARLVWAALHAHVGRGS